MGRRGRASSHRASKLHVQLLLLSALVVTALAQRGQGGGGSRRGRHRQPPDAAESESARWELQRELQHQPVAILSSVAGEELTCAGKCGQTYLRAATGAYCHCDYFCSNQGDCCGGAAGLASACPALVPTLSKAAISSCERAATFGSNGAAASYMPGMCWCDEHCSPAGDCCKPPAQLPSSHSGRAAMRLGAPQPASLSLDAAEAQAPAELLIDEQNAALTLQLQQQLPADAPRQARHAHGPAGAQQPMHDCGAVRLPPTRTRQNVYAIASDQIGPQRMTLLDAEELVLACQAEDAGPPAQPTIVPLRWTAGQVCGRRGHGCVGGEYPPELVQQQVNYLNRVYSHAGIQFEWDGVVHTAAAGAPEDISICLDPSGRSCWVCGQARRGPRGAINVLTSPTHIQGMALGVTLYPSYLVSGELPDCADWVFVYERTLPGAGGRSLIDGKLSDSGHVLAHEIGHQLMLHHTWYEEALPPGRSLPIGQQCEASASMAAEDVIMARSDGVRDTPAQSLNGTANPVTDILRFINCDPLTGAYSNATAFAQQSCTSRVGFPAGDGFYNNYNNLMSYGDRTCLRTLTPGQGARARCAIKCLRMGQC